MLINAMDCLNAVLDGKSDEPVAPRKRKKEETFTLTFVGEIPPEMRRAIAILDQYCEGLIYEREAFGALVDAAAIGYVNSPEIGLVTYPDGHTTIAPLK